MRSPSVEDAIALRLKIEGIDFSPPSAKSQTGGRPSESIGLTMTVLSLLQLFNDCRKDGKLTIRKN